MRIADEELTVEAAGARVEKYAREHLRTLEIFDGLGGDFTREDSSDRVTLSDIGRLVVINAQLQADDVPALLDADSSRLADLHLDADLADCEVGDETWTLASEVYETFKIRGIGPAKRSKLLHLKRPRMFFIHDSRTGARYQNAAAAVAAEDDAFATGFWEAVRRDLKQPEFDELMLKVTAINVEGSSGPLQLGSLSKLRVLDIVCWSA